jgi:hypothetical protein
MAKFETVIWVHAPGIALKLFALGGSTNEYTGKNCRRNKYMKAMKMLLGALMVLMALGGMAMAGDSGTTTVTADLGEFILFEYPAALLRG